MRALALIKGPPPPLAAKVPSSSHGSRGTFAPMLAHLGALGHHLGAHMSQHRPKMSSKMRAWNQHRPKQCPRRLNKPPEPPRTAKNVENTMFFRYFCYPTHVPKGSQIDAKSTQNRAQNLQVTPQVAILAPTWANLSRSCSNLTLPLPPLGRNWATIFREILAQISPKTPQATPRPPKPGF